MNGNCLMTDYKRTNYHQRFVLSANVKSSTQWFLIKPFTLIGSVNFITEPLIVSYLIPNCNHMKTVLLCTLGFLIIISSFFTAANPILKDLNFMQCAVGGWLFGWNLMGTIRYFKKTKQ